MYIFQILDWYASTLTLGVVGFFEVFIICYIYGISRFCEDAALMYGSKPTLPIRLSWLFCCPLIVLALLIIGLWNLEPPVYSYSDFSYPHVNTFPPFFLFVFINFLYQFLSSGRLSWVGASPVFHFFLLL